jgi:predicted RNA-binding protein with PUA domain
MFIGGSKKTIYICEKCEVEIEGDFEKMLDHESGHTVRYSHPIEIEPPTEKESPQQED